jgi:gliding motility-associated-like protein
MTNASTGPITSRHWDFGNGNTSTQTNPSTEYLNPGVYTITLVVSDGTTKDTFSQSITVFNPPTVNFTSDITGACPQQLIHFTNQVTAGSAPISHYAWGFGNGIASSDSNIAYEYPIPGTYDVTLVAQDTNGCDAHLVKPSYITVWSLPVANFSDTPAISCATSKLINFTNQSSGSGLSYEWKFGDDSINYTANPSHLYTAGKYTPTLIVTDSHGCINSTQGHIEVINLKAIFAATETTVCVHKALKFIDESPMPGSNWHWDFGDSTTSTAQYPTKAYNQPGVYTVRFTVTDAMCSDSGTRVNYIDVVSCFNSGFGASSQSSCSAPFTVRFTSQVPPDASVLWYFGDGDTSTAIDPSHTYTTAAQFTVTLIVTDSTGAKDTITKPNFISTSTAAVNFKVDTLFCLGNPVQFYNQTTNAVRYLWNFGDGDTSTQMNPLHVYNSYGRFSITLTAWDSLGCESSITKPSLIHVDSVKISFDVNEKFSMCPPLVSVFSSQANRSDMTYKWDFGDGYTDTAANPTHIYFHPGLYTVKLIGTSTHGCSSTVIDSNLILVQGPSGTFTVDPTSGCAPLNVSFSASVSSNTETVVCDLGDGTLYHDSLIFDYTYTSVRSFYPSFILTDHIGCTVPYALPAIVTHPLPVLNLRDTAICAGQEINIPTSTYSCQWGKTNISQCDTCVNILGQCDSCGAVVLRPMDTATYYFKVTNQYGCSASANMKVMADPIPVIKSQDTIRICRNIPVQINDVENASTVSWVPATYLSSTDGLHPTSTPDSDITYLVTASNQLGCKVTGDVSIKVYDQIPLTVSNDTAVCKGSIVRLNALIGDTFFHNVIYKWSPASYLSSPNTADPTATIGSEAETFTVTVTSGGCPSASAAVTVSVNPSAEVKLPPTIVTTPGTEISISPVSGDLATFSWSAKTAPACAECSTMTIAPTESQVVYLEGRNQYGCIATDSMLIRVVDCDPASVFVPNIFTPNGDGVNDILYVRSKALAEMEYFQIFNRWGAIVFQTSSMSEGWDGFVNGKLADAGTYIYQVKGKCQNGYDVSTNGSITLIR